MSFAEPRPSADPEKAAAQRLLQHARAFEAIQVGRIYIEKINGPFLFEDNSTNTRRAFNAASIAVG